MRNFIKIPMTNENNLSGKSLNPVGIVLHETATQGATARGEVKAFNSHDWKASPHAFIDWTEDIQCVEWNKKGWHACEPANSMFIGVEMCRPKDSDINKIEKMQVTYLATVNAFARIYKYILNINKVTKENCMSHDEVRLKWNKTTHTDPTLYLKEINHTMDDFRKDVQSVLDELNKPQSSLQILKNNKIITNIDSWENWLKLPFVQGSIAKSLIQNYYKKKTNKTDFIEAINYLVSNKIISSKEYWLDNCSQNNVVNTEWVKIIIDRIAKQL